MTGHWERTAQHDCCPPQVAPGTVRSTWRCRCGVLWRWNGLPARRQPRITTDDLRRILDVLAAKGIHGVMEERGCSERNAWRLVARARETL